MEARRRLTGQVCEALNAFLSSGVGTWTQAVSLHLKDLLRRQNSPNNNSQPYTNMCFKHLHCIHAGLHFKSSVCFFSGNLVVQQSHLSFSDKEGICCSDPTHDIFLDQNDLSTNIKQSFSFHILSLLSWKWFQPYYLSRGLLQLD